MRNVMRLALVVVGLVLVVGGGIAAVSPRTASIAVNRAAMLVGDTTPIEICQMPAIDAGIWVGREYKSPGQAGQPADTARRLDGRETQMRGEGFIASSRQEARTQFRVWGIQAQILGIMLLLLAGLTGRRRVYVRPNRAGTTTPVTPIPPATPVGPDPDPDLVVGPPAEPAEPEKPAQPVPAAVTTAVAPVDETGGDLDPAPQSKTPTEPLVEAASDADPAAVAELTVKVTRSDGSTEQVELSGQKLADAGYVEITIRQTIQVLLTEYQRS